MYIFRIQGPCHHSCRLHFLALRSRTHGLVAHIVRRSVEEITLRTSIKIWDRTHHGVIHIHDRKLRRAHIGIAQRRIVHRPIRLARLPSIALRIRIQVRRKGNHPILHIIRQRHVIRFRARCIDEQPSSAVQLGPGVEDELVGCEARVGGCGGHVVRRAVDDEVAKELLALEECAVIGRAGVELVEAVEEGLFGVGEEGHGVRSDLHFGGGGFVGESNTLVAVCGGDRSAIEVIRR